ncbi:Type IIA topoisomerase (DNA gyrase/topo II, topoisomerase IV), A subunit [gamma proteobacterium IMCC1989]|nr:Type IIA topoisomerase (DNA gyrase/topo II, topoisomerase IV), A subunit [gamma proteobacterium IMCC1989]
MKQIIVLMYVSALLFSQSVFSNEVSASKEQGFAFSLHPQAHIFSQSNMLNTDYIIALDKYKKTDNRWMPEKWQRELGQLLRYTIEMPRDYREEEVFDYYRQQLPASSELLFSCAGRQCGESNNWANDHFGVKQLYGTNASQIFSVYRVASIITSSTVTASTTTGSQTYVTIYTVRRGNRRLYTQLDILSAAIDSQ